MISNVVDSSMARESDAVLYTRAGPEIGVAATKTHLAQITALEILALYLAQARDTMTPADARLVLAAMGRLPELVAAAVDRADDVQAVSDRFSGSPTFLFLGRHVGLPGRPRGGAQAEGAGLRTGRGLPGRGAEARPHRARSSPGRWCSGWRPALRCGRR